MNSGDILAQLTWMPKLEGGTLARCPRIIVGGMGGSALPAYALRFLDAAYPVSVHGDYDLPEGAPEDALYVAISASGNTEETLSFARAARGKGLPLAVISTGGELLAYAKEEGVPHVVVPPISVPRNALIYLMRALLVCAGDAERLAALERVALDEEHSAKSAPALANFMRGGLPIFYASRRNGFLARLAKILVNETAKMPAFANVFPELNHNEMQSFDISAPQETANLARFVLLTHGNDDARIQGRMRAFDACMAELGRGVMRLPLPEKTREDALVETWYTAYLAARSLAEERGVEPNATPLVEAFKKRLKSV